MSTHTITPQPGPQTDFMECSADICFYGGAAGGGKSFGLLLDAGALATQYTDYGAVIFRKTSVQVMSEGGLWDTSEQIYPYVGARGTRGNKRWGFPNGSTVSFSYLEHDNDRFNWQGAQVPYIGFDELTHFNERTFWYLVGRNRNPSQGPTYIRATLNPDPDHFARQMVDWYIGEDGYVLPERAGKIRWFVRRGDDLVWADSKRELFERFGTGPEILPRSFTFIPSTVEDNKVLLQNNPEYVANLMALPTVEREQLRFGNWHIRPSAGCYFKRAAAQIVDDYPKGYRMVRYWDRASTEKTALNDPDWTVGLKMTRSPEGRYYVIDVARDQVNPFGVEQLMLNTTKIDGQETEVVFGQDPASAGVIEAANIVRMLAGYAVKPVPVSKDKVTLCKPASSQWQAGNIYLVRGPWNEAFLNELCNFPEGRHDDQVDGLSGAFNELVLDPIRPCFSRNCFRRGEGVVQEQVSTHRQLSVFSCPEHPFIGRIGEYG